MVVSLFDRGTSVTQAVKEYLIIDFLQITVTDELYHMKLIVISVINIILPLNYSCAAVVGGIFNIDVFYFRCMLQV
jgi:hypothetical protein